MKATNLKIGQKYTWRRNSSTIIEVTYLGIDPYTHNFRGHEFSYEKPEGTMYMTLSEMQIDSDIKEEQKPNAKRTIFYVNSCGVMCQWRGEIINKTDTTISIKFSKNKAFRYNLKDLDIDFMLVTEKPIKDIGVCCTKSESFICFDEKLKEKVMHSTINNTLYLWENGRWNQ